MRISDLSSDVCSSDLDTREADGTIFGTLARFFRIANSTPKGAQPTPADGVIAMPVSERIIRLPTVLNRTGLSRSTLYRKIAESTFPAPVQISVHGAGWWESAVTRWIADPPGYRAETAHRPPGARQVRKRTRSRADDPPPQ